MGIRFLVWYRFDS
ncbi:hypothetical protein HID58_006272 [Brassica napus]|uniref:Uncharacterized protein n=1 Tax=Brassica napus TaxID=3708 RepID=A0ABQ8EDX0_BRANA|nr:hypothetical protein HID58_006272 [Brassica napus]